MTAEPYDRIGAETAGAAERRRIFLAPFGWYTRMRLRVYVQQIVIITVGLMAIALSIDLSPRVGRIIAANPDYTGIWAVLLILYYAMLRCADFFTQLLPLGTFLGILWCEVAHTLTRERVVIWNSGRSPIQCLTPALIVAAVVGPLGFVLEAYVRPAAIMAQAADRLGGWGERFDRRLSNERFWLTAGEDILNTRIDYGPPPRLVDVTIYRHHREAGLYEVISAAEGRPGPRDGLWVLSGANRWSITGDTRPQNAQQQPKAHAADDPPVSEITVALNLDPVWLSNYRLYAKYLPQAALETLANAAGGRYANADYRTWLNFRYSQMFYMGGMAVLAVSLCLLLLSHTVRIDYVLAIGFVGYIGHVMTRACLLLGENGYMPPALAAWLTPAFVLGMTLAVLTMLMWRRPTPPQVAAGRG